MARAFGGRLLVAAPPPARTPVIDGCGAPGALRPERFTSSESLSIAARQCTEDARRRLTIQGAVRRRILDLAPPGRRKLNGKLEAWHGLDFPAFRAEIKKAFGADIPLKQRAEWEAYLAENAAEVHTLTARVAAAERDIDAVVYRLFDLTPGEIALLEGSLSGQY